MHINFVDDNYVTNLQTVLRGLAQYLRAKVSKEGNLKTETLFPSLPFPFLLLPPPLPFLVADLQSQEAGPGENWLGKKTRLYGKR